MGVRQVRAEADGLAEAAGRFAKAALGLEGEAQQAPSGGVLTVELHDLAVEVAGIEGRPEG